MTATLECGSCGLSAGNDSWAMSSETVKPMPATNEIGKMSARSTPAPKRSLRKRVMIHTPPKMPMHLPTGRPR